MKIGSKPARKKGEDEDDFNQRRHYENWLAMPRLTCCEASKTHPIVLFMTDRHGPPKWTAEIFLKAAQDHVNTMGRDWFEKTPEVKHCPYCGTPVPEMQKKEPPPKHTQEPNEDDCLTCKEELMYCLCWPHETAYEPVPATKKDL